MMSSWIVFLSLVALACAGEVEKRNSVVVPAVSTYATVAPPVYPASGYYDQRYYNPSTYYAGAYQTQNQYRYPYNYAARPSVYGTAYNANRYAYPANYYNNPAYRRNYAHGQQSQYYYPAGQRYGAYAGQYANRLPVTHPYGQSHLYNYGVGTPYSAWGYNVQTGAASAPYANQARSYPAGYYNRAAYQTAPGTYYRGKTAYGY